MNKKFVLIGLIATFSLTSFSTVLAQPKATEYQLLAPIPLTDSQKIDTKASTATYIPGLFRLMISIATGLAVLMLIYAGIKYMSTDAFSGKEEAKGVIENALYGLLLAIAAWLIVYTIDPNLVKFDLKIPVQEIKQTTTTGGSDAEGSNLTTSDVRAQFDKAGVQYSSSIILAGLRQNTIDEMANLKTQCNCTVFITSGTGGTHANGEFDHAGGYKVDIRNHDEGQALTDFIIKNYSEGQSNTYGNRVFQSPSGSIYTLETHMPPKADPKEWAPHWDVTVK